MHNSYIIGHIMRWSTIWQHQLKEELIASRRYQLNYYRDRPIRSLTIKYKNKSK
jgi:hypothetical protein